MGYFSMLIFQRIMLYFRNYWRIALLSIVGMSLFEIVDLFVPYGIGQILNVLSGQPIDRPLAKLISAIANLGNWEVSRTFSLVTLLSLIGLLSVGRARFNPGLGLGFSGMLPFKRAGSTPANHWRKY